MAVRLRGDTERASTAEKRPVATEEGTPARAVTHAVTGVATRGVGGGVERARAGPAEFVLGDAGTLGDGLGLHWANSGEGPSARNSQIPVGARETKGINLLSTRATAVEPPARAEADWDLTGDPHPEMHALADGPLPGPGKTENLELPPAETATDKPELMATVSV